MLRVGRYISAEGELNVFAPVTRFMRPDFNIITTVSLRLSHWITIDYTYTFLLKQPDNPAAQVDLSTQGVWLRYSFSSR